MICQHGNRRVLRVNPHGDIDRARRPLRGPAAEQPQRPRLPLRRHALLHRPAVRAARRLRRPGQGAAVQRRLRGPRRRGRRSSPTSSRARTGSRSRPTSATSTSATGTRTRKVVMRYDARRRRRRARGDGLLRHDRRARRGRHRRASRSTRPATSTSAAPAASGSSRPTGERLGLLRLPEDPHNLAWGDADRPHALHHRADRASTASASTSRASPDPKERPMSKNLEPGTTLPDFELPDENGDLHRLSELQGDDCLVLMLGRGEHCPRERQHQREMVALPRVVPGRLHRARHHPAQRPARRLQDADRRPARTGRSWPTPTSRCSTALDINEYTDTHHDHAGVPHTRDPLARPEDREGLRRLLVLGPPVARTSSGPTCRRSTADQGRLRPDDARGAGGVDATCAGSGGVR